MKNTRWVMRLLSASVFFCMAAWCVAAPRSDKVGIVQVERIEAAEVGRVGPTPVQMTKFIRERMADAPLTYVVAWNAGGGVAAGTLVTFEYRQADGGHVKFLARKYNAPVRGVQEAFFEIPEGSDVAAWRTRVVYRGRRLAERASDLWR